MAPQTHIYNIDKDKQYLNTILKKQNNINLKLHYNCLPDINMNNLKFDNFLLKKLFKHKKKLKERLSNKSEKPSISVINTNLYNNIRIRENNVFPVRNKRTKTMIASPNIINRNMFRKKVKTVTLSDTNKTKSIIENLKSYTEFKKSLILDHN